MKRETVNVSNERNHLHSFDMPVRWGDMDALGHVNNATYFRYFEQARIAWLESVGESGGLLGADTGPLIVNAFCTYHRAIVYPADLSIDVFGGPAGRSSFETFYEVRVKWDTDSPSATGSCKVVWVDYAANRSIPIPDKVRGLLPSNADR